ncbi:MAG: DUF3108 domain-containing protein, partial [Pedobacter sp.]
MCALKNSILPPTKISFIIVFFLLSIWLWAEKLTMTINYLGLNVTDVIMEDDGQVLTVTAKSTRLAEIAAVMDNQYISEYTSDYLPVTRYKKILQNKYNEDRIIEYDRKQLMATRTSKLATDPDTTYPIYAESRDFFTALFYIRYHLETPQKLYLDANGLIWSAEYRIVE